MFLTKQGFRIRISIFIIISFFFIFFITVQVFAQDYITNDFTINPFLLEIAILVDMISELSSPFSIYTGNPYSSYDPFSLPYTTIPNSPGYDLFPFPYHIGSPISTNFLYKSYDDYNPVSFLNSGYPDFSINPLTFPFSEESKGLALSSLFLQPGFAGAIFPFGPIGLFPGFVPGLFPLQFFI